MFSFLTFPNIEKKKASATGLKEKPSPLLLTENILLKYSVILVHKLNSFQMLVTNQNQQEPNQI